jgi:hypothetical protein
VKGITLDAGALIALDRHDRRVIALLTSAADNGDRVTVPVTVLAQAIRNPARQARLSRLIHQPYTDLIPLTADDARAVGILLAKPERPTSLTLMSLFAHGEPISRS